jgi:hypothetical protein
MPEPISPKASRGPQQSTPLGKLIFISSVALPALCLGFIRPVWVGRLAGVASCLSFLTVVLLVAGFHPRAEFLHRKSKIARTGSERAKRNARRIIRGLVILAGVSSSLLVVRPILEDCLGAIHHGKPYLLDFEGTVRKNDFIFGLYFANQSLIIKDEQRSDGYTAPFFPRLARVGRMYRFVVAPRSRVVLDWSPAP